jgi:predicted NAD/FAD-binding protein
VSVRIGAVAPQNIAVVGSGISGLAAAWLLARRYRVTLFESADWLGGHTHTVDVTLEGITAPVDTGFLVFNDRTYPNLIALFEHLGVASAPSEMSFSVRIEQDRVEWAGASAATLFAQKSNLLRPDFWTMLKDIVRFNREAVGLLAQGREPEGSLAEFLDVRNFGRAFREWYLLPMAAAIWSCPTGRMLSYPAATFLRFCHNHGLLQVNGRPKWRTVVGGGRQYVERMAQSIHDVRLACPVKEVRRDDNAVEVCSAAGAERFDNVVLACHSDQALRMLTDADERERSVLGRVRYESNKIALHTDKTFLPRSKEAWSSWNYTSGAGSPGLRPVSVSYYLNMLQPLPFRMPLVESLNPFRAPREDSVLARFEYSHPIFDGPAIAAQRDLPLIQGRRRTWFCGAWTGYGFHEDGLRSGLAIANRLGVLAPWQVEEIAA